MKGGMTRRSAASVLAGLPLVGAAIGKQRLGAVGGNLSGGLGSTIGYAEPSCPPANPAKPMKKRMEQWQAMRVAMLDPDIKALMLSAIYAQNRIGVLVGMRPRLCGTDREQKPASGK